MRDYIDEYLVQMEVDGRAENTINNTRVRLNSLANNITALDKANINKYILELKKTHKESTVNEHIKTIRTFIKYLYDEGYIDKVIPIKTIKQTHDIKKVISDEEVKQIITRLKKDKSYRGANKLTIFMTFIYTGIRVSELVEIKLEDIDNDTIKIYGKKTKTYRIVPIPPELKLQLTKYLRMRLNQESLSPYLFLNRSGNKRTIISVQDMIKGIDDKLNCHQLRHYFTINLIKQGVPIVIVSKILGHSCLDTTMTYARGIENAEVINVYKKFYKK